MSHKRLVVKGFVCTPEWSELHPLGSRKPETVLRRGV